MFFLGLAMKHLLTLSAIFFVALTASAAAHGRKTAFHKERDSKESSEGKTFRGPWIVHLHPSISHEKFESVVAYHQEKQRPFVDFRAQFSQHFRRLLHATVIEGITRDELMALEGVKRVVPDTKKRIQRTEERFEFFDQSSITIPWGLDRIDQTSLPLDGTYNPVYNGAGADIYIVDTGIDTSHVEFQPGSGYPSRTVKNIYDVYASTGYLKTHPPDDSDSEGHGTHVSGTAGGRSVGVAPAANIYGLTLYYHNTYY
jgi:subtilisin family serine protease